MVGQHKFEQRQRLTSQQEELLSDPQTAAGLLLAVSAVQADSLVSALTGAGVATAVIIGEVLPEPVGIIIEE